MVVSSYVYPHYKPIFEQSNFIYNPMTSPHKLLLANEGNRTALKRSFQNNWFNIYSFGIHGTVEIEFVKQYYSDGVLETWIPDGVSIANVNVESPKWAEFKTTLINEALQLREESVQKIYRQHSDKDITMALGIPIIFLTGFLAGRLAAYFKSNNGQNRIN